MTTMCSDPDYNLTFSQRGLHTILSYQKVGEMEEEEEKKKQPYLDPTTDCMLSFGSSSVYLGGGGIILFGALLQRFVERYLQPNFAPQVSAPAYGGRLDAAPLRHC